MANKLKVWFDPEADFLEVRFSDAAGYEKETNHDAVMERVDAEGHVISFSIGEQFASPPNVRSRYLLMTPIDWKRCGSLPVIGLKVLSPLVSDTY